MPLVANMSLPREMGGEDAIVEEFQDSSLHKSSIDEEREEKTETETDRDSGYEDFTAYYEDEDEYVDSDMEGSILNRPRPKKPVKTAPPALPQRSEKRASRILETLMVELKSLDGSTPKESEKQSIVPENDPHELYLSSEEDASLSDDYDDSDSLVDFEPSDDTEEATSAPSSRASSRKSQEDTARVVSFIVVGKPVIIDIFQTSPERSHRHSMNLDSLASITTAPSLPAKTTRRPTPLNLYPNSLRRMSISSITSSHYTTAFSTPQVSNASMTNLSSMSHSTSYIPPPRKTSRLASLVTTTKSNFQFLSSDPFASPQESKEEEETPKTPTSAAAAAWKKNFSKTLNMARKPSMPKISLAYTAGVVTPRPSNSISKLDLVQPASERESTESTSKVVEEPKAIQRSQTMPMPPMPSTPGGGPVRYEDIMRNVIRAPPPVPMTSPKEKRGFGMGLVRRKSTKGK
jgi:hypothetical protein